MLLCIIVPIFSSIIAERHGVSGMFASMVVELQLWVLMSVSDSTSGRCRAIGIDAQA